MSNARPRETQRALRFARDRFVHDVADLRTSFELLDANPVVVDILHVDNGSNGMPFVVLGLSTHQNNSIVRVAARTGFPFLPPRTTTHLDVRSAVLDSSGGEELEVFGPQGEEWFPVLTVANVVDQLIVQRARIERRESSALSVSNLKTSENDGTNVPHADDVRNARNKVSKRFAIDGGGGGDGDDDDGRERAGEERKRRRVGSSVDDRRGRGKRGRTVAEATTFVYLKRTKHR